jgi:hypothetical protein
MCSEGTYMDTKNITIEEARARISPTSDIFARWLLSAPNHEHLTKAFINAVLDVKVSRHTVKKRGSIHNEVSSGDGKNRRGAPGFMEFETTLSVAWVLPSVFPCVPFFYRMSCCFCQYKRTG